MIKKISLAILFVVLGWLLTVIPFKLVIPNPLQPGTGDFDIYDLRYSGTDKTNNKRNSDIVLVKIGSSRKDIAMQIMQLKKFRPALIAVDAVFEAQYEDSTSNDLLSEVIKETPGIIQAAVIHTAGGKDSVIHNFFYNKEADQPEGFITFKDSPTIRTFIPFCKVNDVTMYSFDTRIVEKYAPHKLERLQKRNHEEEIINYSGGLGSFNFFTQEDLEEMDTERISDKIEGKIVLLGFFDSNNDPGSLDDLHYTPFNKKLTGRTPPDTYGVVIHANIIAMILGETYISTVPKLIVYIFSGILIFVLLMINDAVETKDKKVPGWLKLLYAVAAVFFTWCLLLLYDHMDIKIPLEPLLISLFIYVAREKLYMIKECLMKAIKYISSKKWKFVSTKMLVFALVMITTGATAQFPDYFVDLVKGEVVIIRKGRSIPVKYKDIVYKSDTLKILKDGSSITLVNREDCYVNIDKKGIYPPDALANLDVVLTAGITKKYLQLLREEIVKHGHSTSFNKKNIIGVKRSACRINLFPGPGWVTGKDTLFFSWSREKNSGNYTFILKDEKNELLYKTSTRDTFTIIPTFGIFKEDSVSCSWIVTDGPEPCDDEVNHFTWMTASKYARKKNESISRIQDDGTPYYYVRIAAKMFEQGYFDESGEYLVKALKER